MDSKPEWKNILEVLRVTLVNLGHQNFFGSALLFDELP